MATNSSTIIQEVGVGGESDKLKWKGLNTSKKDPRDIELGESPDSLNWITSRDGDNISLRRGQLLLGNTRRSGGACTGLGVGTIGNTQVPYYSANQSIYYYTLAGGDTSEVTTANVLGVTANGEDVTFIPYQNIAGSWVYATSPHSGVFKLPVANPGSVVNQNVLSYRFSYARIDQNRTWGVGRYGSMFAPDLTSLYVSNVDKATAASYTGTADTVMATGDGVTANFSNTITVAAPNTIFGVLVGGPITAGTGITAMTASAGLVTITSNAHGLVVGDFCIVLGVTATGDAVNGNIMTVTTVIDANNITVQPTVAVSTFSYGSGGTLYKVELFVDQGQGTLISNLGGTGTVNYATGAVSVTFITPPTSGVSIIENYFSENATSGGVWDFTFSSASPSIGEAYQFQQGGGGNAQAMAGFQGVQYVVHQTKSWTVGLPTDTTSAYTDATSSEYWSHIGIPYRLAQYPTGDGVLFLDNTNPATPKYSILAIPPGSTNLTVVPQWVSQDLDLSVYDHSSAVVFRWGEYNILACREILNGIIQPANTAFFIQNITSGYWNLLDYSTSCMAEFLGALMGGDSLSPNVETLFSGLDDDGNIISNSWTSGSTDFDFSGEKKLGYVVIQGLIQRDQSIQVSLSLDGGLYQDLFTILGTGTYVSSISTTVGSNTVGSTIVGGGGGFIEAFPFTVEIPVHSDLFQYLSIGFEALGIGWAQIDRMSFKDIRLKRLRLSSYAQSTGIMS